MSLFLPSNLSPNFEEITPNAGANAYIEFKFQVNTNGSCVRSYKLEILNDKNDAENPDDNILATFYGTFDPPLYNKEIGIVTVDKQQDQMRFEIEKDYRWRIRLYEDEISMNDDSINIKHEYGNTYVGEGNIVGSTKNVIWLSRIDEGIVEEKFIQTVLYSHDMTNDFNPFNDKIANDFRRKKIESIGYLNDDYYAPVYNTYQKGNIKQFVKNSKGNIVGAEIDLNEILPEYRKKISDGNMYICIDYHYDDDISDQTLIPQYDTNSLPKLITGFSNNSSSGYETTCIIDIDERQQYIQYDKENNSTPFFAPSQVNGVDGVYFLTYSLVYIQREQIYSIDKSVGKHQLTKVTLDEPFYYNTFHNTKIESGLVSDDFDYSRIYIDPVKEFDSKLVPSAYINIAYTEDQLIDCSGSGRYSLLTNKPDDWNKSYDKYFEVDGDDFRRISKTYSVLTSESAPQGWNDGAYKDYYIRVRKYRHLNEIYSSMPTFQNGVFYGLNNNGQYDPISEMPSNWGTMWSNYYYVVEEKYEKIVDSKIPEYKSDTYYECSIPEFSEDKYYVYGIPQTLLSSYNNSLSCTQLINYVAKTGECSLFSDLKFKPDRFYMYQIFIIDQAAPNYDVSKSDNPYKFYTGVNYLKVRNELKFDTCWYLGGQKIVFEPDEMYNPNRSEWNKLAADSDSTNADIPFDYNGDGQLVADSDLILLTKSGINITSEDTDNIINQKKQDFAKYLRTQNLYSYVSAKFNYNNRNNTLQIYSNHQIEGTNQYMCFVQPNLGIYEDRHKPCMLQIYNNRSQHDLYITNYNGNNEYNKDYSIDTLDNSQWLIALTYSDDISNLEPQEKTEISNSLSSLIQKPQTKYKIYTNFVNSIPEAYFYYRDDKTLTFNYYDYYSNDNKVEYNEHPNDDKIKIIKARDIMVKCDIFDSNHSHRNFVPIKHYQYTVAAVNPEDLNEIIDIVYEGDVMYDGKYQCELRGFDNYYKPDQYGHAVVENPTLYRIQITAEDEYGNQYNHAEDVYFGYNYTKVIDRISSEIDCLTQSVHVDFSPIKTFRGVGEFEDINTNDNYIYISGDEGLTFEDMQDVHGNKISIGNKFLLLAKFKLGDDIFNNEMEHDILEITTNDKDGNDVDTYTLKFDTRVIVQKNDKIGINSEYLYFKLYKNKEKQAQSNFIAQYPASDNTIFVNPNNLEYAFSKEIENTSGVYIIDSKNTHITDSTLNTNDDEALLSSGEYQVPSGQYYIYDNSGKNINYVNKNKLPMLCVTISTLGENTLLTISDNWGGVNNGEN